MNDCRKKKLAANYMNNSLSVNDPSLNSSKNKSENWFLMEDINAVMETVPEKYMSAFIMQFEGYKYYEIAEYFNVPEGTVKTRIHAARKLLQKKLSNYRDLKP
ncbi:ECF subfamily RNA polymerase sigma-24 factor [Mycobacterium tuberculosis]|nr:ECF subfamily RNA polymerase sigma-24 factor [Mycobacterium tuberculosis]